MWRVNSKEIYMSIISSEITTAGHFEISCKISKFAHKSPPNEANGSQDLTTERRKMRFRGKDLLTKCVTSNPELNLYRNTSGSVCVRFSTKNKYFISY